MPPRRLEAHMIHSVLKNTLSKYTLETLPSDVIVEILNSHNSFKDLRTLIESSAVFYRHFREYSNSILTQVAKNIIGKDAWEDATAVLVYQRNAEIICSNPSAVKEELEGEFVLQKKDIPQFVANQRYFDCCCERFSAFVCKHYPQPTKDSYITLGRLHVRLEPNLSTNRHAEPSFSAGDTLPIKLFYQMWRLSLRFTFDSFNTFVGRKQQLPLADLWVVSRAMSLQGDHTKHICGSSKWTHFMPGENHTRRLIDIWGRRQKLAEVFGKRKLNNLARMKAMLCLRLHVRSTRYRQAEQKFAKDYKRYLRGEISLEGLFKLYDLEME